MARGELGTTNLRPKRRAGQRKTPRRDAVLADCKEPRSPFTSVPDFAHQMRATATAAHKASAASAHRPKSTAAPKRSTRASAEGPAARRAESKRGCGRKVRPW